MNRGELSDRDYDRMGIRLIAGKCSKDDLIVYRGRGCILTKYSFIKARLDKIRLAAEAKAAKADAALATKELMKMRKEDVLSRRLAKYGARKSIDRPKATKPSGRVNHPLVAVDEKLTIKLPAYLFK